MTTPGMHPTAAGGFVDPVVYERGRPDYAPGAVAALSLTAEDDVLDLGCGTGKFTRQLAGTGARVVGAEPLAGMLGMLRAGLPTTPAVRGLAEALPFASDAFDVVACASAFHWFDHDRALPEIARILRPTGRLAIVWNRRDGLDGWPRAFFEITERHRGTTPGYRSGAWRDALGANDAFGPITEHAFDHVQRTTADGLIDRVASVSFIELLPPAERAAVLDESRAFLQTHPETRGRTMLELPYRTVVYTAARLPDR